MRERVVRERARVRAVLENGREISERVVPITGDPDRFASARAAGRGNSRAHGIWFINLNQAPKSIGPTPPPPARWICNQGGPGAIGGCDRGTVWGTLQSLTTESIVC